MSDGAALGDGGAANRTPRAQSPSDCVSSPTVGGGGVDEPSSTMAVAQTTSPAFLAPSSPLSSAWDVLSDGDTIASPGALPSTPGGRRTASTLRRRPSAVPPALLGSPRRPSLPSPELPVSRLARARPAMLSAVPEAALDERQRADDRPPGRSSTRRKSSCNLDSEALLLDDIAPPRPSAATKTMTRFSHRNTGDVKRVWAKPSPRGRAPEIHIEQDDLGGELSLSLPVRRSVPPPKALEPAPLEAPPPASTQLSDAAGSGPRVEDHVSHLLTTMATGSPCTPDALEGRPVFGAGASPTTRAAAKPPEDGASVRLDFLSPSRGFAASGHISPPRPRQRAVSDTKRVHASPSPTSAAGDGMWAIVVDDVDELETSRCSSAASPGSLGAAMAARRVRAASSHDIAIDDVDAAPLQVLSPADADEPLQPPASSPATFLLQTPQRQRSRSKRASAFALGDHTLLAAAAEHLGAPQARPRMASSILGEQTPPGRRSFACNDSVGAGSGPPGLMDSVLFGSDADSQAGSPRLRHRRSWMSDASDAVSLMANQFHDAALLIQTHIRWLYSAQRVGSMLYSTRVATRIQMAYRGHVGRRRCRPLRASLAACIDERLEQERDLGASLVRGLYWSLEDRVKLTIRIQCMVRGVLQRMRYLRTRHGIVRAQRVFRLMQLRRRVYRSIWRGQCVFRVQRAIRCWLARRGAALRRRVASQAAGRRVELEQTADRSAVCLQCAWRSFRARMHRGAVAQAVQIHMGERVATEAQMYNMSNIASSTIERTVMMYTARLIVLRLRRRVQDGVEQRVVDERRIDAAAVVVQMFTRMRHAREVVARQAEFAAQMAPLREVQATFRGKCVRRWMERLRAQLEAAEDARVEAERRTDIREQERSEEYTVLLQALWRRRVVCMRLRVYANRTATMQRSVFWERQWMQAEDYHRRTLHAVPVLQRAFRVYLAKAARDMLYGQRLQHHRSLILREMHWSAACVQRCFHRFQVWRGRYLQPTLQIQLWWQVQRRLRKRRHHRAACIIARCMRKGVDILHNRRIGNFIAFLWRCRTRRRARMFGIARWVQTVHLTQHAAAIAIQVRWRTTGHLRVERKAREQIERAWREAQAAMSVCEREARAQLQKVSLGNFIIPKLILNAYLRRVAALWEEEEGARGHIGAMRQRNVQSIAHAQCEGRLTGQRKTHVVRLVHTLRRVRHAPAGVGRDAVDVDVVVWNRHRLPVDACRGDLPRRGPRYSTPQQPAKPRGKAHAPRKGQRRGKSQPQARAHTPTDTLFEL